MSIMGKSSGIKLFIVLAVVLANLLIVLTESDDENYQKCLAKLPYKSGQMRKAAEYMCKNKVEFDPLIKIGKRNGYECPGLSEAQKDFMEALSGAYEPWTLQDWPSIRSKLRKNNRASWKSSKRSKESGSFEDWPVTGPDAKIRKDYRMLTDEERQKFHNAVNVLKAFIIDDTNSYGVFVKFHNATCSPAAHFGPNFIGWHREYVYRFERALQLVYPDVTVPYWDTTMDAPWQDNAVDTVMWTEDFQGNRGGEVVTGPFKNWPLTLPMEGGTHLFRGVREMLPLINEDYYNYVIAIDNFRNLTSNVDPTFEITHGNNHAWVGGVMEDITQSPDDPIFFPLHCYFDKVWHDQQKRVFRELGREHYFYPRDDDRQAYGLGPDDPEDPIDLPHYWNNPMWPFVEKKNYEGLEDVYWEFIEYVDKPSCSAESPSCGYPFLFCAENIGRCLTKLGEGGNCTIFQQYDSCYNSQCVNNICTVVN